MVALNQLDAQTKWGQLEVFMTQWRRIEPLIGQPGPFIWRVSRTVMTPIPLDYPDWIMLTQPDPKAPRDGLGSCEWIWALAYQRTDRPHTPHKPLITRAGGCGQSALEFGPCLAALPRRRTRRVSGTTWRHPPGNASRRWPDGYPGRAAVCRNRQPLSRLQPLPPGPRANPAWSSKLRFIAPGDSPRSVPSLGAIA